MGTLSATNMVHNFTKKIKIFISAFLINKPLLKIFLNTFILPFKLF
jgi:hypothetical protein